MAGARIGTGVIPILATRQCVRTSRARSAASLRRAARPFCSKRCADVDLNRWLSGGYVVPGNEDEDEDGAEMPGGTGRRPNG